MARDAPHVVEVGEDERLVRLKAAGDDVARVLKAVAVHLLELEVLLEVELLVVGELDHERAVEDILQPAGTQSAERHRVANARSELERQQMPEMHAAAARTAAGIEEERLAGLVAVEDEVQVAEAISASRRNADAPVREDDAAANETMRFAAGQALEAGDQLGVERLGAELLDQLAVIDRDLAISVARLLDPRTCLPSTTAPPTSHGVTTCSTAAAPIGPSSLASVESGAGLRCELEPASATDAKY